MIRSAFVLCCFQCLSQGVETNPGPPPTSSATYSRDGWRGRGAGVGRGGGDGTFNVLHLKSQPTGRVTRSSSQNLSRQPSIND